MPVPLELTVFQGDRQIACHHFQRDIVKIGRLESAHLTLDDTRVSRIHAVIEARNEGDEYAIIDMGSTEGTFINGRRVANQRLSSGDRIVVGDFQVLVAFGATTSDLGTGDLVAEEEVPRNGQFSTIEAISTPQSDNSEGRHEPVASARSKGTKDSLPEIRNVSGVINAPQTGRRGTTQNRVVSPQLSSSGASASHQSELLPTPSVVTPSEVAHPNQRRLAPARPSVPSNLASSNVPDDERALEAKLLWGHTVLDTLNLTDKPSLTLGDEREVSGFGPAQKLVRCDIEVPSYELPSKKHILAERQGTFGTTYLVHIPAKLAGRIERADGLVIPISLLYQGRHGAVPNGSGGVSYLLHAEETLYINYGDFVLQIRYVRRTRLASIPIFSQINYNWANVLICALFAHLITIGSFVFSPNVHKIPPDELLKNRNRFIETRLKLIEPKPQTASQSLLDKIKKGPAPKVKGPNGKAGRRKAPPAPARMASVGRPDDKEQARRAVDKLFGLGRKGKVAGLLGGEGLGGELKSAMGGLQGKEAGEALGLRGLGTRGSGPGGGGLALSSVGLGKLGTAGRGGGGVGGTGYGQAAASIGTKKDRDVEIKSGKVLIRGSLSKDIIRRVIQKHINQVRYCYEKRLQVAPGLFGKVGTKFVIDAMGSVSSAQVVDSTLNDREVERCITNKIRTWRFPQPKGGGIVEVKYPFLLKASG